MRDDLDPAQWSPDSGRRKEGRIEVGDLIGYKHAAWRVKEVTPVADFDLTAKQRYQMTIWKPGHQEKHRPYYLVLVHVSGPVLGNAQHLSDGTTVQHVAVDPSNFWGVPELLGERHQVCSCHGHPWPCQDVILDQHTAKQAAALDKVLLAASMPGACNACLAPISRREKSVTYRGDNLDMPGGPEVRFHSRAKCWYAATRYELRWLAADPRRERILTYPECPGSLIVHFDGSSECLSDRRAPDCQGHLTHDHSSSSACYSAYPRGSTCPRGCRREGHAGCGRTTPRPARKPSTEEPLFGSP